MQSVLRAEYGKTTIIFIAGIFRYNEWILLLFSWMNWSKWWNWNIVTILREKEKEMLIFGKHAIKCAKRPFDWFYKQKTKEKNNCKLKPWSSGLWCYDTSPIHTSFCNVESIPDQFFSPWFRYTAIQPS